MMSSEILVALSRSAPLLAVAALGFASAWRGLFPDIRGAIAVLNRFALYVAFPMLITAELTSPQLELPDGFGFYGAHLLSLAALSLALWVLSRWVRPGERGGAAIASFYGNIAYLGIPFCAAVLGSEVSGLAALSAAIHVTFGLIIGPWLLVGVTGGADMRRALMRVLRLPLVWTPALALVLRQLPLAVVEPIRSVAAPVGASAGPVALFMLGLYLFVERDQLRRPTAATVLAAVSKLGLYPALMFAAAIAIGVPRGSGAFGVLVLQAAMPTAITTFALAAEFRSGEQTTARAIVFSTIVSMVTLPIWVALIHAR